MDEQRIGRVWLSYFGTASGDYYGIAYNHVSSVHLFRPSPDVKPTPWIAISATMLQGTPFFERFKREEPVAKIGYSIFVYRMKGDWLSIP